MKVFIRTLWKDNLWDNKYQREDLKQKLNDLGFYVLTGPDDSLDVYALTYEEPSDILILYKLIDKLKERLCYKF